MPPIDFWAFVRMCINTAWNTTISYLNLDTKSMVVAAISLIIGVILFAVARNKKDAQSKAWERFLLIVAPAGLIAILLFGFNLCRSPLLVYRAQQGAVQQAEARVKQVEAEKKVIATDLEREKDKSQPKFELGWGTSIIGNDVVVRGNHKERHTHIFLPVTVLNHGAPSIIKGLRVTAKLKDGRELEGSAFIPSQPEFVFHMPDGPPARVNDFETGAHGI